MHKRAAKDTTLARWISCRGVRYRYGGRDLPSKASKSRTSSQAPGRNFLLPSLFPQNASLPRRTWLTGQPFGLPYSIVLLSYSRNGLEKVRPRSHGGRGFGPRESSGKEEREAQTRREVILFPQREVTPRTEPITPSRISSPFKDDPEKRQ